MERNACENKILKQLKAIQKIVNEYCPESDYLSLCILKDSIKFNNDYWIDNHSCIDCFEQNNEVTHFEH